MTGDKIMKERLERLREAFAPAKVDALVVSYLPNVRYLTGFSGSAATLLVTRRRALLLTDGRYRVQAAEQLAASSLEDEVSLVIGGVAAQQKALSSAISRSRAARVGLEAEHVSWATSKSFAKLAGKARVVPTKGLVEAIREVKDAREVALIGRACAIADQALGEVAGMMTEGATEAEVAMELDATMRRHGAEDTAFDTIVASGANSAKPHARPGPRRIRPGDAVVVDFGACYQGYRSDMTRTFLVPPRRLPRASQNGSGGAHARRPGRTREIERVFDVVRRAQEAGLAAVRAGVSASAVDAACRDLIAAEGYGELFEHSTGHGVGLDIHEAPPVAPGWPGILHEGSVVTVEPGVYVAGLGGVRIEDTVVVTSGGCRVLTRFPKDPWPFE